MVDNAVIKSPKSISSSKLRSERRRIRRQHLCLNKAYISEQEEQELIKRGYVLYIPIKKEKIRGGEKDDNQKPKAIPNRKKLFSKEMGCRKNQFMVQQIQETIYPL